MRQEWIKRSKEWIEYSENKIIAHFENEIGHGVLQYSVQYTYSLQRAWFSLATCRLGTFETSQGKFRTRDIHHYSQFTTDVIFFPRFLYPNAFQGNSNSTRKIIESKAYETRLLQKFQRAWTKLTHKCLNMPCALSILAFCSLNTGLERSRSGLIFKQPRLRKCLIVGMLYWSQQEEAFHQASLLRLLYTVAGVITRRGHLPSTRWFQVMGIPRWGGHCLTVIYSN